MIFLLGFVEAETAIENGYGFFPTVTEKDTAEHQRLLRKYDSGFLLWHESSSKLVFEFESSEKTVLLEPNYVKFEGIICELSDFCD